MNRAFQLCRLNNYKGGAEGACKFWFSISIVINKKVKKILLGLDNQNTLVFHSFCFSSFCYEQDGGVPLIVVI